jgi:hypothetical protein
MFDWEGVLPEETNEAYHRRPEYSSSDLKYMLDTPLHFKRMVIEKDQLEKESNKSFDLGSCAHECFLLQDTSLFVALPEGVDRRTKEGKQKYEDFVAANGGKRIITQDQLKNVMGMFEVISSNELVSSFLDGSEVEKGALYLDEKTGLKCKFRPDIINLDKGVIIDYKTAQSAAPHEFSKAAARYYYHLSAAHYIAGAERLWPGKITKYKFIVQQNSYPYALALYDMDASDIFRSLELRDKIMAKIKHCTENDLWPDWSMKILQLSIPGYGFTFSEEI